MMTKDEVKDELIGGFPPGIDAFFDFSDIYGDILEAQAETIVAVAIDASERLRLDINPLTCGASKVADWEAALRLDTSRTALTGTLAQRRRAVIARLRETGATTLELVRSVIGPLLDYADDSTLAIVESDRTALTALHTYNSDLLTGSRGFSYGSPATLRWFVRDDAKVSATGAWVDLTLTTATLSSLTLTLTAPDGRTVTLTPKWRGAPSAVDYRCFFRAMAGAAVYGNWSLTVGTTAMADSGEVTAGDLFVEGFGLDSTMHNGLSAAAFEWAVVYEPDKSAGSPDFDAARAAIRRINYATRIGALCMREAGGMLSAGDFAMIPDDVNALPDQSLPG